MNTPQILYWLLGLAGGTVFLLLLRSLIRRLRIRRFHIVKRGVLYRGGQPGTLALWFLARVAGIRTIVNLRSDFRENEVSFGMKEHRILLPPRTNLPTQEQVERFLEIMDDPANRPVLAHCKVGANRTGIMVAAWRILRQGWDLDQALTEMGRIRGGTPKPEAVARLREITEALSLTNAETETRNA